MTVDQYIAIANGVFDLSLAEAQRALNTGQDLVALYPKIVVMYEFFRLIRGEAFTDFRPPTPDFQQSLIEKEGELEKILDQLKAKIDFKDQRTQSYIDQMLRPYLKSE
jgi:hypothetical protein